MCGQLNVLLRKHGVKDDYHKIISGDVRTEYRTISIIDGSTREEGRERDRKLLKGAGKLELLEQVEEIWVV